MRKERCSVNNYNIYGNVYNIAPAETHREKEENKKRKFQGLKFWIAEVIKAAIGVAVGCLLTVLLSPYRKSIKVLT